MPSHPPPQREEPEREDDEAVEDCERDDEHAGIARIGAAAVVG